MPISNEHTVRNTEKQIDKILTFSIHFEFDLTRFHSIDAS